MATWSRRLSAAQAKQPGTSRRDTVQIPEGMAGEILPDDQAALRAVGHIARDRPGFHTRLTVHMGDPDAPEEVVVEITSGPDGPVFSVVEIPGAADELDGEADDDHGVLSGDRVAEMLTDSLVLTSDIVAIFASVGAEALWANDAFATTVPIRESDKIWLVELLDEWSKGHFEVNVLPALVQNGRWQGSLVFDLIDEELPVLASLVAHRDMGGEIEAITMVARDLRRLREAEERTLASTNPLARLVEKPSDLVVVVEPEGTVRYASPAFTRSLGLPDGALDGSTLLPLVHDDDRDRCDFRHLAEPDEDGISPTVELRVRADDDSWRILEMVATDLTANQAIASVVVTARDVTDRVEAVQRLADRAYTDPLTLLPNRMRLLDRLGKALHDAGVHSVVVVLFDVDGFTAINEEHGRAVGDELLRQVARRLTGETRPLDVVARLSGDEFAMVVRKISDVDSALVAADRVRQRLGEPYRVEGVDLGITVSVGVAVSREGQSADELVGDADTAIGIAKEHGGNRIEVMTAELRKSTSPRRHIEEILHKAIVDGEGVEVHYQPVIDLESGRVVASEALLRVHDDDGALLSPASFLEAAEDSGMIGPLGGQVLQLTCRQLAMWRAAGDPNAPGEVSVNVSPRQLAEPSFPATVADAIEGAGIPPECLGLEITEGVMIGDRGIVDDTVAAVRNMGVSIGLDDFGAGQSSLGYLKRFPLDFVKIDRGLISGLGRDEGDTAIVRATVELAHGLGLVVVAVGVETEEQLEIVRLLGVDRAQGFYFLPALPADEVTERVRKELSD